MKFSLEKFSSHYRDILAKAVHLAMELNAPEVAPEFLFVCLLEQKGSLGNELLHARVDVAGIKQKIRQDQKAPELTPILSEETIKLIDTSASLAVETKTPYIGTEHLLLALLRSGNDLVNQVLKQARIDTGNIQKDIKSVCEQTCRLQQFVEPDEISDDESPLDSIEAGDVWIKEKKSPLEMFTRELTDPAVQHDPVSCRDHEISRLSEILLRRTKNNPLLLGEPGVGKTAVVEGLAKQIQEKKAPPALLDKKIYSLDLSALVAGTMYRGEFEGRIRELLDDLEQREDVIIFIDELHNIIGAGATQGSMDVANLLKPALARGSIRCIGATTYKEYKKHITQDSALDRRFQPVHIGEPTVEQTRQILQGLKKRYEQHHYLTIDKEALQAAIDLSVTYLPSRHLPDKAIDLLDEACARKRLRVKSTHPAIQADQINRSVRELRDSQEEALFSEQLARAQTLQRDIELKELERKNLLKKQAKNKDDIKNRVTVRDVVSIVCEKTGLPQEQLMRSEKTRLRQLDTTLKKQIIGQDQAVKQVAHSVRRAHLGFGQGNKPKGSFVFIGPSGVGKTYLARILAQELFHSPDALIKVDMSEFSEKHTVSKLIGSPAGYVGYRENSHLVEMLRRRPASVVLFDEIEKAHPDIFNLMLQVLDDGYLTDGSGDKVDFRNTYLIFTSNLGSEKSGKVMGFGGTAGEQRELYQSQLRSFFRPEFINRIDDVVTFDPLDNEALQKIATQKLRDLRSMLKTKKITCDISDKVASALAGEASGGVRDIDRRIQQEIENKIIQKILRSSRKKFSVATTADKITIR